MLKQLAGTTVTKISTTILGFLTVILATQFLGASEYGNISIFLLSLSLLQLVSGVAGGPALVYLVPRLPLVTLLSGALTWTLPIHMIAWAVLSQFNLFPRELLYHLLILSIIFFFNSFAFTTLLGQQRIKLFNLILLLQALMLLLSLALQIYDGEEKTIMIYIRSLYISSGISTLTGWMLLLGKMKTPKGVSFPTAFKQMIRYGGFLQIANAVQLFNYRLSYFLIDHFMGRGSLGVYTAGVQLSEGVWIFGKSFAVVQYSSISNSKKPGYALTLTLRLIKLTFIITAASLIVLFLLPESFYGWIFGQGFEQVKKVILFMGAGILMLSLSQILSHYFSGTGQQHHNAIGSAIGLVTTLASGLILIPRLGLAGAGITASLAYSANTIYQFVIFIRMNRCGLKSFLISREEVSELKGLIHSILKKK